MSLQNTCCLSASAIKKSFGEQTLFSIDACEIHDGERIGLVGQNGCGKTTLLRILSGEYQPDSGSVTLHCPVSIVHQAGGQPPDPQSAKEKIDPYLRSLLAVKETAMSGGERTRLALCQALSQSPGLLLADEPSQSLDGEGLSVLGEQLRSYPGALVLVSHDRTLLDTVCTCIWALEDGRLRVFPGNYSAWQAQRRQEREFMQFEYTQYQNERQRIRTEINKVRQQAGGMLTYPKRMGNSEARLYKDIASRQQKNVQSRAAAMEKRLSQLDEKKQPEAEPQVFLALGAYCPIPSKTALRVQDCTVRFGAHTVLEHASFSLPTGSRSVMLGKNGAGKTTLINELRQKSACVRFSGGAKPGFFCQGQENLDWEKDALENVLSVSSCNQAQARGILARLLLPAGRIFRPVKLLSGGERAKVALATLLAGDYNILVLDEPTNHIDLYAAKALEGLLAQWQGTLLIITHDRLLTQKIAGRLLWLDNGAVRSFEGGWQAWEDSQKPRASADDLARLMEEMRRAQAAHRDGFTP